MRLIVNADDFGQAEYTTEYTIKGFECGALTSATLMAGMPATDIAVAYAKTHPQFSFGVHFYLVDEVPMSLSKDIPSMVNPKTGRLWSTRQFIVRNFMGLVRVEDVLTEMRSQYFALKNAGVPISHVDGHGHNHRLPQAIRALQLLQKELDIGGVKEYHMRVRRCQNIVVGKMGLLGKMINGPMQGRLERAGFLMTDGFAMNAGHSNDPLWFTKLLRASSNSDIGTLEIGIHPGEDVEWRRIDTEDCYANCMRLVIENGIELGNFNYV